jgi:hypothetical protein
MIQEFQVAGENSVWKNHGRAIKPAITPNVYPKRGLKKTRAEAHKKTNGLTLAATSTGRSQLDRKTRPRTVRNVQPMLPAVERRRIAVVSLGVLP